MTGKGSLNHNSRKFHAKNTDPNRTHWNVEYCNEDIKDVLGFDEDTKDIKHNFRQLDALPYAKDGMLEDVLEELYPEQ